MQRERQFNPSQHLRESVEEDRVPSEKVASTNNKLGSFSNDENYFGSKRQQSVVGGKNITRNEVFKQEKPSPRVFYEC